MLTIETSFLVGVCLYSYVEKNPSFSGHWSHEGYLFVKKGILSTSALWEQRNETQRNSLRV